MLGLDWLNFFLADVQSGIGPFFAVYLAGRHWNEQNIGIALTVGGIAGIAMQTPTGWFVDRTHSKRALVAVGVSALAASAVMILLFPSFWAILLAQIFMGAANSIFTPAICAISLGIVGHDAFDCRQGRNQTFNSSGNLTAALFMGLIGYWISNRGIFFFVFLSALPTFFMLWLIRPEEISYEIARESDEGTTISLLEIFSNRLIITFLICAALFHFANAAMLPLLGEMLTHGQGRSSMMFMSACVVTTQLVIAVFASWCGRKAKNWGRKPLLLIAFGVLPFRGILYTMTNNSTLLIAIQILDGVAGAIFSVVSVLVIADLTRGTGRFNVTLGAMTTAASVGAALSQSIAGTIVHHFSFRAGFQFLASIAMVAYAVLYVFMPETRDHRSD